MRVLLLDMNRFCADSAHLARCLREFCESNGWTAVASLAEADAVLLNSCNIVQRSVDTLEMLRGALAARPELKVLALGCTPPGAGELPNLRVVTTRELSAAPERVGELLAAERPFRLLPVSQALAGVRLPVPSIYSGLSHECAPLKIATGCDRTCTYCAYAQARGGMRSVPLDDILRDFDALAAGGVSRFSLVCDDATSWGRDIGLDLFTLLSALERRGVPGLQLLTNSFNPVLLTDRFLDRVDPFLDLFAVVTVPIQSGSDRILKLMNRGYRIEQALARAARLRRGHPKLWISTDVIVGFPTETYEEFKDSIRAAARFDLTVFLAYVSHPGTAAGAMTGRVASGEVRRRMAVVHRLASRFRFLDVFPAEAEAGAEP